MDLQALYQQLDDAFILCDIDGKKFVPRDSLEKIITAENVKSVLGIKEGVCVKAKIKKPSEVPGRVAEHAKRIFAALVLMDNKVDAIHGLLEEDLTDEDLPLARSSDPKTDRLISHDKTKTFPFDGWSVQSVNDFIRSKQWPFLAPVLDTSGQLIKVDAECALPFMYSKFKDHGAAGTVHEARLHPAHQRGYEDATVDLKVAVKQFHQRNEFEKENKTLQDIKDLQHPHIIRHLASIDKGDKDKGYIVFPWAAGGSLQNLWATSTENSSQRLVLWSLQQMLGLTGALDALHDKVQCRHGDLKPGNILCVHEGGEIILKLADFGISRIHHAQTTYRKIATTTGQLTPSYQGPEVEFEKANEKQRPRSRKYDIWSMGCVFLEFIIWLLHGPKGVEDFFSARGHGASSTSSSIPLYSVTDKAASVARVHKLALWTIKQLQNNDLCKGNTALATLLDFIQKNMLETEVDKRPSAAEVCTQLGNILQEAENRPEYLLNSPSGAIPPTLDFEMFHSDSILDG